jgi:hypothetical protein
MQPISRIASARAGGTGSSAGTATPNSEARCSRRSPRRQPATTLRHVPSTVDDRRVVDAPLAQRRQHVDKHLLDEIRRRVLAAQVAKPVQADARREPPRKLGLGVRIGTARRAPRERRVVVGHGHARRTLPRAGRREAIASQRRVVRRQPVTFAMD